MQRRHHQGAFAQHPSLAKEVMGRRVVGYDVAVGWGHVFLSQIFTCGSVEHFQPRTHLFPPGISHHRTLCDRHLRWVREVP